MRRLRRRRSAGCQPAGPPAAGRWEDHREIGTGEPPVDRPASGRRSNEVDAAEKMSKLEAPGFQPGVAAVGGRRSIAPGFSRNGVNLRVAREGALYIFAPGSARGTRSG